MDEQTRQAYQKIRREHPSVGARHAKRWAQEERDQQTLPELPWEEPESWERCEDPLLKDVICFAVLEYKGFDIRAEILYDTDHDWQDSRGKFTRDWEKGAMHNPEPGSPRDKQYFVPEYSEGERRRDLQKLGHSKGIAGEMARDQLLEDIKIARDGYKYIVLGITATASLEGEELGYVGLWGTEVTSWEEPYVQQIAWENIEEAVRVAQEKLNLKEGRHEHSA